MNIEEINIYLVYKQPACYNIKDTRTALDIWIYLHSKAHPPNHKIIRRYSIIDG